MKRVPFDEYWFVFTWTQDAEGIILLKQTANFAFGFDDEDGEDAEEEMKSEDELAKENMVVLII